MPPVSSTKPFSFSSLAKRLETHGVTALDLGFSEKAIETLSLMKQTGDFAYFNWLLEHETGGFMEDAFEYTYGGRLFDQIVKLLRFSEQAHLWPEIQIDGIGQVTLSKAHRVSDSYPVSDLILRDIKTEVRYILNDLEDIFTRKGELSAGKEHFSRPSEYEVL